MTKSFRKTSARLPVLSLKGICCRVIEFFVASSRQDAFGLIVMLTREKDSLKTVTDPVFLNTIHQTVRSLEHVAELTSKSPKKSSSVRLALGCVHAKSHAGISGNDRLDGRLILCLVQLFGCRSPHHAAAASHRSRGSDTTQHSYNYRT